MLWITIKQLQSGSARVRLKAVHKLRGSGSAAATAALIRQLGDRDVQVRAAVAEVLGEMDPGEVVQPLLKALHDSADEVKESVIGSLQRLGDKAAVNGLRSVLESGSLRVRSKAARALVMLGWDPVDGEETTIFYVATGRIDMASTQGAAAVGPLVQVLRDGSYEQRVEAASILGRIEDERTSEPLLKALQDEDPLVRTAAAGALGLRRDPGAVLGLRRAIQDKNRNVRTAAVEALGDIGDLSACDDLRPMLADEHWEVRAQSLLALGKLRDQASVESMIACLNDPDKEVRQAAADALAEVGAPTALGPLVLGLIDPDAGVRQSALRALWRVNPYWERSAAAAAVVPELRAALRARAVAVQHAAALALRHLGDPGSGTGTVDFRGGPAAGGGAGCRVLLELLADMDPAVRMAAVEGLERWGDPTAERALQPVCGDRDRWVREAAARAVRTLRLGMTAGGERSSRREGQQ
jgi:HEAT repeat protein